MTTFKLHPMESYQDRFGRNIAARLSDTTQDLPNDISERLKAARMQALAKRKVVAKLQPAVGIQGNDGAATLSMDDPGNSIWNRLGSLIPLLMLIVGLLAITIIQDQRAADEIAGVDAELLADDLPPSAYADQGFVHFLNANRRD